MKGKRMNLSLEELADEYARTADTVTMRINERTGKLRNFAPFSSEASRLKSELNTLYSERRDVLETVRRLRNYYTV